MCLGVMMVVSMKQHLSNIWSSIHEEVKQHWNWINKIVAYKKSVYYESKLSVTTTQKPLYIDSALIYVEMLNLGTIKQFFLVPSENITKR